MNLPDRIRLTPFLRIVVPMIAGILLAPAVGLPTWAIAACLTACYALAWLLRGDAPAGWCYLTASILLTGLLLAQIHSPQPAMPRATPLLITAEITETPYASGRWLRTTAETGYYRGARDSARHWRPARERLVLCVDTSYHIALGDQIAFTAYLNAVDRTGSGYGRLMQARGYTAAAFVTAGHLAATTPNAGWTPLSAARHLQQAAVKRLERLHLTADRMAVATAMSTGEKRALSPSLKAAYSATGTSHVLAVSGLHTGIVFLLVNGLLWLLPLARRGHLAKNILAVAALWAFAMMSGLSPSVIRAALMCSALQIALAVTARNSSYNILFGAAVVMLAIHPGYLRDLSFQLSFLAVLSILFCYKRLYRIVRTRYKALNYVAGLFLMGLAAQIGTLPIIMHTFGNLPVVSLLVNPPVVLCASAVVLLSVVWILIPIPWLNPVFSTLLGWTVEAQNSLVEWAAGLPMATVRDVELSTPATLAIYGALLVAALLVKLRERTEPFTLPK